MTEIHEHAFVAEGVLLTDVRGSLPIRVLSTPGMIGMIQATETVKLLMGIGEPLVGRFLIYDALRMRFRELKLRRDPQCPTCGDGVDRAKIQLVDYDQFCASPSR